MCAAGRSGQETMCEDVGISSEQFREEGDIWTTGAGEPGVDFLSSDSLRSTTAPAHLAVALWYHKHL